MRKTDKQWSFEGRLFESRTWRPRRSNLGPDWKSILSQMIPDGTSSSPSTGDRGGDGAVTPQLLDNKAEPLDKKS
jgi:hypothetical protein